MSQFWNTVRGPLIRAGRTFAQTAIGVYLASVAPGPMFADLADVTIIEAGAAAGVVAVLALVMNMLEESRGASYDRG